MPKIQIPTAQAIVGFAILYIGFSAFQKNVMKIPVVGQYLPGGQ